MAVVIVVAAVVVEVAVVKFVFITAIYSDSRKEAQGLDRILELKPSSSIVHRNNRFNGKFLLSIRPKPPKKSPNVRTRRVLTNGTLDRTRSSLVGMAASTARVLGRVCVGPVVPGTGGCRSTA